jgi:hypothetical protein
VMMVQTQALPLIRGIRIGPPPTILPRTCEGLPYLSIIRGIVQDIKPLLRLTLKLPASTADN